MRAAVALSGHPGPTRPAPAARPGETREPRHEFAGSVEGGKRRVTGLAAPHAQEHVLHQVGVIQQLAQARVSTPFVSEHGRPHRGIGPLHVLVEIERIVASIADATILPDGAHACANGFSSALGP